MQYNRLKLIYLILAQRVLGAQIVPQIPGRADADHELAQLGLDQAEDQELGSLVLQQGLQRNAAWAGV